MDLRYCSIALGNLWIDQMLSRSMDTYTILKVSNSYSWLSNPIYIYICHAQSIYLRCCWIQYESLNSAPINGYNGEYPILVRHLWIAQLYMDPLFGCAIWSNCANLPNARDIYIIMWVRHHFEAVQKTFSQYDLFLSFLNMTFSQYEACSALIFKHHVNCITIGFLIKPPQWY